MNDLKDFLLDNVNFIVILLFLILPVIVNVMKSTRKKPAKDRHRTPQEPRAKAEAGIEQALETKVRKFFENIVVAQSAPRSPSSSPVSVVVEDEPSSSAQGSSPRDLSLEDRRDEEFFKAGMQTQTPLEATAPLPPPLPRGRAVSNQPTIFDASQESSWDKPETPTTDYEVKNLHIQDLVADGVHLASFQRLSRSELRRAIVLKEILDKPVGLKS